MLKLAGETDIGAQEKIESILYNPGISDTTDLEGATKNVTATAEATGTGNADYNAALTVESPGVAWVLLKRIAERLDVTIDSMTAGTLYCRVYIDQQDADHRLFDLSWTTAGAKVSSAEQTSGTIFDLLTDGQAHTFYFFFWVDASSAVLSVVRLRVAIGTNNTTWIPAVLIDHTGLIGISMRGIRAGSASAKHLIYEGEHSGSIRTIPNVESVNTNYGDVSIGNAQLVLVDKVTLAFASGASDELSGLDWMRIVLRSEQ